MKKRNQTPFNREARARRLAEGRDPQRAKLSGVLFVVGVFVLSLIVYFNR